MLIALFAAAVATFPTLGRTWIVDDDGGPGVDFTTLQPAFDAAAPHDVILVQPGAYVGATLTKGVRVVGQGGPTVSGTVRVNDVPGGELAVVSGLRAVQPGYSYFLAIANCQGTVVGDDLQALAITVTNSLDVRIHRNAHPYGIAQMTSTDSRVEVVDSQFRAPPSADQFCGFPADPTGPSAAQVSGGELHASRSSFRGGDGGDSSCGDLGLVEPGGDGGIGILLAGANTRLLLSGVPADVVMGGIGGDSWVYGTAPDGAAVWIGSTCSARYSGVTIGDVTTFGSGLANAVAQPDPTLRTLDLPSPGQNVTLRLTAPAGSTASVSIGSLPTVAHTEGVVEDVLVVRARTLHLGVVPANGILGLNEAIPVGTPPGTVLFAQATARYPSGEVRRTQSVPLVVR